IRSESCTRTVGDIGCLGREAYFSARTLMFLNATSSPWAWRPRRPVLAIPYGGHALNLLAATWAFHLSDHSSYSTTLVPFSQCSTCAPLTTRRAVFHSPARFAAGAGWGGSSA